MIRILIILSVFIVSCKEPGDTLKRNVSDEEAINLLKVEWKFEIGDDPDYRLADYYDQTWDRAEIPGAWEDWGYPGYDGYAWYRCNVHVPQLPSKTIATLLAGRIDDVNSVFFNGQMVGQTGFFPPLYETAFNRQSVYSIPNKVIKEDTVNVLAIRVFDGQLSGGILEGPLELKIDTVQYESFVELDGYWKFKKGDDWTYKDPGYDDSEWDSLIVPLYWEYQGYENLNGYAWYREEINVPAQLKGEDLVLILGKIDDVNEVYVNGKKIGSTGVFPGEDCPMENVFWQKERFYYIPREIYDDAGKFLLAVRVYDCFMDGGIYEGPIGLISSREYREKKN